jgi:nucleotide-binding universal stress UspA family protein
MPGVRRQRGAETEITLVHVDDRSYSGVAVMEQIRIIEGERLKMQQYLEEKAKMIRAAGIPARYEMLNGNPAGAIIKYVKENPTQLIAMATHGHSGISRMNFGSVTETS